MEIMLITVVAPLIRCEWQLQDWQVALVTTVSDSCSPKQVIHHVVKVMGTTMGFGKHLSQQTKQIPRASLRGQEQC